jgi:hypothetical protein
MCTLCRRGLSERHTMDALPTAQKGPEQKRLDEELSGRQNAKQIWVCSSSEKPHFSERKRGMPRMPRSSLLSRLAVRPLRLAARSGLYRRGPGSIHAEIYSNSREGGLSPILSESTTTTQVGKGGNSNSCNPLKTMAKPGLRVRNRRLAAGAHLAPRVPPIVS